MKVISLIGCALIAAICQTAHADSYVYQCKLKNGQMNFSDSPCAKNEKDKGHKVVGTLPIPHSVAMSNEGSAETESYQQPHSRTFCDHIDSRVINAHYDQQIQDAKNNQNVAINSTYLDSTIKHLEFMRQQELRGCQSHDTQKSNKANKI